MSNDPLLVEEHDHAVILPPSARLRRQKILSLAVLDGDGRVIDAAACATEKVSSAGFLPEPPAPDTIDSLPGRWFFGGLASHHFGHQITRSLGRLACLQRAGDLDGIAFARLDYRATEKASLALFARLLTEFGIDLPFRVLSRPVKVERLVVGADLFSEGTRCLANPTFVSWVRKALLPEGIRPGPGRRLYVTRSRLPVGTGQLLCEDILERNLAAAGFEVFAPEQFSLAEQILRYARAETIVTTDGSHCHVIAFSRQSGQTLTVIGRRKQRPQNLFNHLESFGTGLAGSRFDYLDATIREWWPPVRADNLSLAEADFALIRERLIASGILGAREAHDWVCPTGEDVKQALEHRGKGTMMPDEKRQVFLKGLRLRDIAGAPDRVEGTMMTTETGDPVPAISGMRYFRMLKQMHARLKPDWYLEIGTFTGRSLTLADCNYIAVDPAFQVTAPIINKSGKRQFLFQETSDDFFASGFLGRNSIRINFAFLDGLHHFEALLRDFINMEQHMAPDGVIALHDCCPTDENMAKRDYTGGLWTGDVWKTLLILLRHRPDLDIRVASAEPTGLVVVRGLDPENRVLSQVYDRAVAEYSDMRLSDLPGGLGGLYRHFRLEPPSAVLSGLAG